MKPLHLLLLTALLLTACDKGTPPATEEQPTSSQASAPSQPNIDEAIAKGEIETVKEILAANPSAASTGTRPTSPPLHSAINRQKPEIALLLIASGADVNAVDSSQRTPLHLCVERDLPDLVAPLVKAGAKPDERDGTGWTPLHHTGAKNRVAVATALLDNGADINARSERGGTPMHEAAASGGSEIILLFLERGNDITVVASNGVTALDVAKEFNNEAAIELLSASE